jgi:uncharacterized protein
MKFSRALAVLLVGSAILLGSCVPLGSALYQAFSAEPAKVLPATATGQATTTRLELSPGRRARLVVDVDVQTASVEEEDLAGSRRYHARYRFPLSYRVEDATGRVIADTRAFIDWRDDASDFSGRKREASVIERDSRLAQNGGGVTVRAVFRVFDVPADGIVTVSAELGADTVYGARASSAAFQVEHHIDNPATRIVLGVFMLFAGFIATVIGFVLVVARPVPHAAIAVSVSGTEAAAVRQLAMLGHLAGLLGFVIPFANVLAPLVLWLVNRTRHPYLDEQGREALNFQLTILVYLLLAFGLVLALVGLVMIPLIVIFQLVMVIVAAVRVNDGEAWRYPVTLRFLR